MFKTNMRANTNLCLAELNASFYPVDMAVACAGTLPAIRNKKYNPKLKYDYLLRALYL
jgi:hypothetical protein